MKHSMKKKRSRPSNQDGVRSTAREEESEEHRILMRLMEAFTSVSLEEAASAYREANSDVNKAAEILGNLAGIAEDEGTSCSSSSGDGSLSYAVTLMDPDYCYNGVLRRGYRGAKQKKVIAATGTVSNVLGKEYVPSSLRRDSSKPKGCRDFPASKEDADQFLCSMLGENCELSMAVIRDVLCQCGHDVEKALDVLLELSASFDRFENDKSGERTCNSKEGTQFLLGCSGNLTSRPCDSTSCAAETKIQHNMWSNGYHYRNYSEVLTTSDVHSLTVPRGSELELAQNVLQSLFKIPKSAEHDPHNMNWRDLAKKMETLGQGTKFDDAADPEHIHAKGDEYQVLRKAARQHWDSMKSFYQKAATAFSNGERDYAAYLSEQGRVYNKIAQEVDEKASQKIFIARNKKIENVITIDLHGQHVKQAIRLLKVHLLFGAYVRSVQIFRVITGCGSHGVGKSKLKLSVMNLLEREGIKWSEENRGTILVRLDEQRKFTFLESESDDDSE